jgi:hypothetical protein
VHEALVRLDFFMNTKLIRKQSCIPADHQEK